MLKDGIVIGVFTLKSKNLNNSWNCECICGKKCIKTTKALRQSNYNKCRCNIVIGEQFNRLTIIKRLPAFEYKTFYICECKCDGKQIKVIDKNLKNGHTQSCGCLHKEIATQVGYSSRKYPADISAITLLHKKMYKECNFNDFIILTKQNCFYCNKEPSNIIKSRGSDNYICGGIDRVDSTNKSHASNYVVSCCAQCNYAKSNYSFKEFIIHITRLINVNNRISFNEYRDLSNNIIIPNLQIKDNELYWRFVKSKFDTFYHDGDLTIEQFYKLSQLNCYYCGQDKDHSNKKFAYYSKEYNLKTHTYYYNGLDQIIPSQGHNYDNIITCCKKCNYAKLDYSLEEFYLWIDRLRENKFWNKVSDQNTINNGICNITL